jgi:hypothetical protein
MDAPKHAGTRSIVSLAYDNRPTPNWKKREQASIPGPLYDLFWIGAFLIALVGYLARPI